MTLLYTGNGPGDKGTLIGEDVTYAPGVAFCVCVRVREGIPKTPPVQWAWKGL